MRKLHVAFHGGCINLQPQQCLRVLSPYPCQLLFLVVFWMIAILSGVGGISLCFMLLICIFLMVSDAEFVSRICWPSVVFRKKKPSQLTDFKIGLYVILMLSCMRYLYSLNINSLTGIVFANIFSPSADCLFCLSMVFLPGLNLLSLV